MRALTAAAAAPVLIMLLAGCADRPLGESANAPAERGRALAEVRCAPCHAIGPVGDSPRSGAPPFRDLRVRFNEITWERTMAQIAAGGHDTMPPVNVEADEIRDLQAFIRTVR